MARQDDIPTLKFIMAGESAGKTSLMLTYTSGKFPTEYVPTVFDNYETDVLVRNGHKVKFSLWDTAAREGYNRATFLAFPKTDVFLCCFSVVERWTFESIRNRWLIWIQKYGPAGAGILLVGTKSDLREDETALKNLKKAGESPITLEQCEEMVTAIGADGYVECSALKKRGVNEVFERALEIGLNASNFPLSNKQSSASSKHHRCAIL